MHGARYAKVPQSLIIDLPEKVHVDVLGLEGSAPHTTFGRSDSSTAGIRGHCELAASDSSP
jgi:hypothetical protein